MSENSKISKTKKNKNGKNKTKSVIKQILKYFLIGFGTITLFVISIIIWITVTLFSGPGVMEITEYHPFRSKDAKEKYLSHYDQRVKNWPIPSETKIVETSYGQTFIRISGPDKAPPLVLLPGGGSNSLIWLPIIETLSGDYKTYAVDNIYDFGRSIYSREMITTRDLIIWLDEMFDVLELEENINLMGLSYGGWMASQYALHAPSRLDKVILLAPAATILPFSFEFIKHMIISVIPHRYFTQQAIYWSLPDAVTKNAATKLFVDNHVDDAYLGLRCFKFKQPPDPTVMTDDKLRSLKIPVLFMVGENEKIYNARKAIHRIKTIAPQIKAEIISKCGHDLWITQSEIVCNIILEFLRKSETKM
jgi:pimeloyl-ACP methyl ester carboxylesterase